MGCSYLVLYGFYGKSVYHSTGTGRGSWVGTVSILYASSPEIDACVGHFLRRKNFPLPLIKEEQVFSY